MICWFKISSNEVNENEHGIYTLSSISSSKTGIEIVPINFRVFIALSTSRSREVIGRGDWVINADRYLAPNKDLK